MCLTCVCCYLRTLPIASSLQISPSTVSAGTDQSGSGEAITTNTRVCSRHSTTSGSVMKFECFTRQTCGWRLTHRLCFFLLSVRETSKYHSIFLFKPHSAQQLIGSLFTRDIKMETQNAFFFFFGSCTCERSWRLKSPPVSVPAGAPLSLLLWRLKHASSVVSPF